MGFLAGKVVREFLSYRYGLFMGDDLNLTDVPDILNGFPESFLFQIYL